MPDLEKNDLRPKIDRICVPLTWNHVKETIRFDTGSIKNPQKFSIFYNSIVTDTDPAKKYKIPKKDGFYSFSLDQVNIKY